MTSTDKPVVAIRVWDPFVRIFHWTLVACVLLNFGVVEEGEDLHQWLGWLASGLVAARVVWGFVGTRHARFADFFPTPQRIRLHLQAMRRREPDAHPGHNPLGALMMLVLMALVAALGLTGWMQTTDRWFGEEWLMELHEALANGLMVLAGVHAAAAIVMGRLQRVNLVKAMVTGVKRWS